MKFYRKLPHLNNNKINNPVFRWAKELNRLKMLGTICHQHRATESHPPAIGMADLKNKEETGSIGLVRLGCQCALLCWEHKQHTHSGKTVCSSLKSQHGAGKVNLR